MVGIDILCAAKMAVVDGQPPIVPAERTYTIVRLVKNVAPGLYRIRVRSKYTVCVHDEPDDCEIKAVVQARVKNLDVREDVTRKIQHTLETTGLWIFQSPQPPSNDNCNGFVDACGVEKIVTVDLKERNGTLLNCGCFRPMPDDPPSARRVPMPKAPEEPSSETLSVSTFTKIIEGPLKLTPVSFVTVICVDAVRA